MNWWKTGPPAAWEAIVNVTGRNLVADFVSEAHSLDMHFIAYHYIRAHKYYGANSPEYWSRDQNGKPIPGSRGQTLCVNSGYRDIYLGQVRELVELGIDGIYFDEYPYVSTGCYCDSCRAKFREWSGGEEMAPPGDTEGYRKVLDFATESALEFFSDLADVMANASAAGIAAGNRSDVAIPLFSAYTLPCADNGHHLFETLQELSPTSVSTAKIEYDTGRGRNCLSAFQSNDIPAFENDVLVTLGWAMGRDSALGNLPHNWFPNSHTQQDLILCGQAALLTWGNIANLDHEESLIPNATLFEAAYARSKQLRPYLAGAYPLREAALLFAESLRDDLSPLTETIPAGPDVGEWRQLLMPTVGVWSTLERTGVQAGVVMDWQLSAGALEGQGQQWLQDPVVAERVQNGVPIGLAPFSTLILPLPATNLNLTSPQQAGIQAFEEHGGVVITQTVANASQWANLAARPHLKEGLYAKLPVPTVRLLLPHPFETLPSQPTAVAHAIPGLQHSNITLLASNEFLWCGERDKGANPKPQTATGLRVLLSVQDASQVVATDILTGNNIPVQVSSQDAASFILPDFESLSAVHLSCKTPKCLAKTQ